MFNTANNFFTKIYQIFLSVIVFAGCSKIKFYEIPAPFVYTIEMHGDSLYYSTPDGDIFRFNPDSPDSVKLTGFKKGHPIRSLTFTSNNHLYASSYYSGLYQVSGDTMKGIPNGALPAWSMKLDSSGTIWLAARNGIFKQTGDSFVRFTNLREAYDLDFFNGSLVAADRKGISFFDLETGKCIRSICKDTICWMVHSYDTLLIGGGQGFCAFIKKNTYTTVKISTKENIPWDCVMDKDGTVFLASQKGLFSIDCKRKKSQCIGYPGKCIKSVFIDDKMRLWVGKYFREKEISHYGN